MDGRISRYGSTWTSVKTKQSQHLRRANKEMPKMYQRYSGWVNNAVWLVEPSSSTAVVARFAGKRSGIPNAASWVKIDITNANRTKTADGMYYIRLKVAYPGSSS